MTGLLLIGITLIAGACAPASPAPETGPAAFTVSNLGITPGMPKPGDNVMVSVKVTNTGGQEGTYTVVLKVNGATATTKDVTLTGGASQNVVLTITAGSGGIYTISIDALSGRMQVMNM